jgi:ribonuclease III
MLPEPDLGAFERALGHRFRDHVALRTALTHRSYANENPERARQDNERLEFLGDAVLAMVASALLWERFPEASEGELTRLRAALVCEASLAELGRSIGLGAVLRLGKGEERSGGRAKARLLCCAFEAVIAAVYLEAGLAAAEAVLKPLLLPLLATPELGERDAKTRVQELVQARGGGTPRYSVVEQEGPEHARVFHVACTSDGSEIGRGSGRSKLEAEQQAARAALSTLLGPGQGAST